MAAWQWALESPFHVLVEFVGQQNSAQTQLRALCHNERLVSTKFYYQFCRIQLSRSQAATPDFPGPLHSKVTSFYLLELLSPYQNLRILVSRDDKSQFPLPESGERTDM